MELEPRFLGEERASILDRLPLIFVVGRHGYATKANARLKRPERVRIFKEEGGERGSFNDDKQETQQMGKGKKQTGSQN